MAVAFELMKERLEDFKNTYLKELRGYTDVLGKSKEAEGKVRSLVAKYTNTFGDDCKEARKIICDALEDRLYDEEVKPFATLTQAFGYFSPLIRDELSERFQKLRSERVDHSARFSSAYGEVIGRTPKKR